MRGSLPGLLIGITSLSACDPGELQLVAPERVVSATPALTIHSVLEESYADLASTLGWEEGIPNAGVRVHRTLDPYDAEYWTTAKTDEVGIAVFNDLLAGIYEVEVTRALTAEEAVRAGTSTRIVAGGRWLRVPGVVTREVATVPNRASGLVFSEVAFTRPLPWEASYGTGRYMELFNNSSATVFMDGMFLGLGWNKYFDVPGAWTCTMSQPFRTDPGGIWSKIFFQFPGSGSDFPVAPGASVLIAMSAVDHSSIHWTLSDLSGADFEFGSGGTAGNPDVPDLVEKGPTGYRSFDFQTKEPLFLAHPVDLESLPRRAESWLGYVYLRFPRESIIDATMGMLDLTKNGFEASPFCSMAINPEFERLPGPALWGGSDGPAWTRQRRVLPSEGGRKILQDTNTSMADFVRAWKTPGEIPDSSIGGV